MDCGNHERHNTGYFDNNIDDRRNVYMIKRLALRNEIDFSINDVEYRAEFDLNPKEQYVLVGEIKRYRDKFDTRGVLITQDERPRLYERLAEYLEGYIWQQ